MTTIAVDTETRGLEWYDAEQGAFLATVSDADGDYAYNLLERMHRGLFVTHLEEANRIICHNFSFDCHMIRAATGVDLLTLGARLDDTDLMSRVLFPEGQRRDAQGRGGHGLKNLGRVFLNKDAGEEEEVIDELARQCGYKNGIKPARSFKGGPWLAYYDVWRAFPKELEAYAMQDTRLTYGLATVFDRKLAGDPKLRACYEMERNVMPVLIGMEQYGTRVDPARVKALTTKTKRARTVARKKVIEGGIPEVALGGEGSRDEFQRVLTEELHIPLYRKTETGILKTDHYALQEFEDDFPVIADLMEYRRAEKMLSTYLGPMAERQVIHPSFMQCGAWTGRMSCRRPNMQNLPKRNRQSGEKSEFRSVFVPRDGHVFIVSDYDSIEIRLLAYYMADAGYKLMIEEGLDPHAWMASNLHGGVPEDYAKGTPGEDLRNIAKHTLFAITYGAGAPRVSDMNKITREEARDLIRKIKTSLPGYRQLSDRVRKKVEATGYVTTLDGRRQPVNKDKAYVGLNALIQGSAAGIMKLGLANVAKDLRRFEGRPVLVVHDEVVSEVPEKHAHIALAAQDAALEAAYKLDPPLKATGAIVTDYGKA